MDRKYTLSLTYSMEYFYSTYFFFYIPMVTFSAITEYDICEINLT